MANRDVFLLDIDVNQESYFDHCVICIFISRTGNASQLKAVSASVLLQLVNCHFQASAYIRKFDDTDFSLWFSVLSCLLLSSSTLTLLNNSWYSIYYLERSASEQLLQLCCEDIRSCSLIIGNNFSFKNDSIDFKLSVDLDMTKEYLKISYKNTNR